MQDLNRNTRFFTAILLLTLMLNGVSQTLFAQPADVAELTAPANDNFANAQTIGGTSGTVVGTNVEATKETGERSHADNIGGRSLWYKYNSQANGNLTISTTGSTFDTLLDVYYVTGGSMYRIADNDDETIQIQQSSVTIATLPNSFYYIAVDGYNGGTGALSGTVLLNWSTTNAPSNDDFSSFRSLGSSPRGYITASNVGASKQQGEADHAGNVGGKSVWFKWIAPSDSNNNYTFSTAGSRKTDANNYFDTLLAIYGSADLTVPVVSCDNDGSGSIPTSRVAFYPAPGATYYIAVDGANRGSGTADGTITLKWNVTRSTKAADFDADGKADISLFRPTDGNWYSLDSIGGVFRVAHWGANGDKPAQGDYDGDGQTDYAVFRPSTGVWYISNSQRFASVASQNVTQTVQWGLNTDTPAPGDYDGDNQTDIAVFRPSNGTWYVYSKYTVNFGLSGDIPVPADYNGDGKTDFAVYRPSNGTWYVLNLATSQVTIQQFGSILDKPVPADYNGDGRVEYGLYRPATGTWYTSLDPSTNYGAVRFGLYSDVPQPGDYDGDSRADIAVFRPSDNTWYIRRSNGNQVQIDRFGSIGDVPVAAAHQIP